MSENLLVRQIGDTVATPAQYGRASRVATVATLALAATFGATSVAEATPPAPTIEHIDNTFITPCPQGFNAVRHDVGTEKTSHYSNGTQVTRDSVRGTIVNDHTGKKIYTTTQTAITFAEDRTTVDGLMNLWVEPGKGVVFIEAGRIVMNLYGEQLSAAGIGLGKAEPNACNLLA